MTSRPDADPPAEVTPTEAARVTAAGGRLIDVRLPAERYLGTPAGALRLDRADLARSIAALVPDRETPLLLICNRGVSSLVVGAQIRTLGYGDVRSVAGGFERWRSEGLPVVEPQRDADIDRERYARQLAMPDIGESGQRRLLAARVLLVGAGGLGSPAALYLAAAGVGHLTIVDDDTVSRSNLHRQILHTDDATDQPKVESARSRLQALNPTIEITTHRTRLAAGNVAAMLGRQDVVIDGSDNFETRYLVNDACVRLGIPDVHGSVFRHEGQVTVFWPARDPLSAPCYRCLYPEPPPRELAPSCAEAGVLGVLPGIIGMLQATEALKLLLGLGEPLIGRLLHYDALAARFTSYRIDAEPGCLCRR
jgi:molybdopterin/thiamine biosynthesis adenylyltransferase/rhodanese-related sulfurtransferase